MLKNFITFSAARAPECARLIGGGIFGEPTQDILTNIVNIVNGALFLFFILLYLHQFVYLFVSVFRGKRALPPAGKRHRLGIVICARNEEKVLGQLIESIRRNDYPAELVDIFVVADNCTDQTAALARSLGCIVYERNDPEKVGKGFALHYLFEHLHADPLYAERCDAYVVLDADNILTKTYLTEMNKVFDRGYDLVTSYRNSKNFGENWIASGYGYWFLHESCHLNSARMTLGSSCAISGTGFLIARDVVKEYGNWEFFTLTEDIECSTEFALSGRKIGFAKDAMLFDEQPSRFRQSWRQREGWAKGFYQVFAKKGRRLMKEDIRNFSCYDILTTICPALLITLATLFFNTVCAIVGFSMGNVGAGLGALAHIGLYAVNMYLVFLLFGGITLLTEHRKILCPTWKKIFHLFLFPLFMFTYLPIALVALFKKVEWKPIYHTRSVSVEALRAVEEQEEALQRVKAVSERRGKKKAS